MNPASRREGLARWPLPGLGVMHVSGADAETFLDGQLSNSVARLGADRCVLAAWCDAKGRAVAVLRVWRAADDGFLLQLPAELLPGVVNRLRLFVLRARVAIAGVSPDMVVNAVQGSDAAAALAAQTTLPEQAGSLCRNGAVSILRLPGSGPRYQIVGPAGQVAKMTAGLSVLPPSAGARHWRLGEIRAGLPQLYAATQNLFVPQMLNLHWLGGIDFQKGCYPGQEVVARLQYRGSLKRRMYRARVAAATGPGAVVTGEADAREGTVLESAATADGASELLAVIRVAAAGGPLMVAGQPLQILELPYATG